MAQASQKTTKESHKTAKVVVFAVFCESFQALAIPSCFCDSFAVLCNKTPTSEKGFGDGVRIPFRDTFGVLYSLHSGFVEGLVAVSMRATWDSALLRLCFGLKPTVLLLGPRTTMLAFSARACTNRISPYRSKWGRIRFLYPESNLCKPNPN